MSGYVYTVADYDTYLTPRPWGDCACRLCIEWMLRDLRSCNEKCTESEDGPNIETVCNGLSRWSVWIPLNSTPHSDFGLLCPVSIDCDTEKYLTSKKVINWWYPSLNKLHPIKIVGDGNCLPHAVSMGLWGIQDTYMTLRHLLYVTLLDADDTLFRERWRREKEWQNSLIPDGGLQYTEEEWNKEWSLLVTAAEDQQREFNFKVPKLPYESLEEVHIFVLANLLRRPIIVLAEPDIKSAVDGNPIAQNNLVGIYLPLLWSANLCHRYPLVLCFLFNHFEPLLSRLPDTQRWQIGNYIPLVTSSLENLHVHFTLAEEETKIYELIQNYLSVKEIPHLMKDGSTELLLVAHLPRPATVVNFSQFYQRERQLLASEVQLLTFDKELVYKREENVTALVHCISHKLQFAKDIQYFMNHALPNLEVEDLRNYKLTLMRWISHLKAASPPLTTATVEEEPQQISELNKLMQDLKSLIQSTLGVVQTLQRTRSSSMDLQIADGLLSRLNRIMSHPSMNNSQSSPAPLCVHCHRCHCINSRIMLNSSSSSSRFTPNIRIVSATSSFTTKSHGASSTVASRTPGVGGSLSNSLFESRVKASSSLEFVTTHQPAVMRSDDESTKTIKSQLKPELNHDITKCSNEGCDRPRTSESEFCRICAFQQSLTAQAFLYLQPNVSQ